MFESSLLSPLACHPSYGLWLPLLLPPRRAPGIPKDNLLLLLSPPPPPPPRPPPSAREANDPEAAIGARADHDLERMHNYVFYRYELGTINYTSEQDEAQGAFLYSLPVQLGLQDDARFLQ